MNNAKQQREALVWDNLGRGVPPLAFKRSGRPASEGGYPDAGKLVFPKEAAASKAKAAPKTKTSKK
jgi:hypothetical protein